MDLYFQWEAVTDSSYLDYEIENDTVSILGFNDSGLAANVDTLVIPSTIEALPVTKIASNAFDGDPSLETVVLGNSIKTLSDSAFANTNISKVVLTDAISSYSSSTFDGCTDLVRIELNSIYNAVENGYQAAPALRYAKLNTPNRSPRYILVAGSSGRYGIDYETFCEDMDMDIILTGGHAPFGIYGILSVTVNLAQAGDVIIVAPEYSGYMYGSSFASIQLYANYRYISKNSDVFKHIDYQYSKTLVDGVLAMLQDKPTYTNSPYTLIDDNGINNFYRKNNSPDYGLNNRNPFSAALITERSMDLFSHYARLAEAKGAKLYFSYAPYNINALSSIAQSDNNINAFQDLLRTELTKIKVPLISNLRDYLFEGKHFYDSDYHLSSEGAVLRTLQLVSDIKAQQALEVE